MIEEGVRIIGNVKLGKDVSICAPAELMAKDSQIDIGDGCDIAAFVTITTADSHARCIGLDEHIDRRPIKIGAHVFIGVGAVILGGAIVGHHSVIGANVVIGHDADIPPYSRVTVAAPTIRSASTRLHHKKGIV
jgi:acetyltransferase-like isoleucine patch superfamily enzyme